MKIVILASGSAGNCTYLNINNIKILIDIGISNLSVEKKLNEINVKSSEIDYIFITHCHSDHVSGLDVFMKKNSPQVFMMDKTYEKINFNKNYKQFEKEQILNDISILKIPLSHDENNIGFLIEYRDESLVYITDTGYLNVKNMPKLKNKQVYIFESNHDINLLMEHPSYPYHTKQRILGSKGHLSNNDAALYLAQLIGTNTKCIALAHLSERSNTADIALNTLTSKLEEKNISFNNIMIAKQNEILEIVYD